MDAESLKQCVPASVCCLWRCEFGLAPDHHTVAYLWFPSGGSSRPELSADQRG